MTAHPLVAQLRFTRGELLRCLEGVSDEQARQRLLPMNCISWMVGHLASQEHFFWVMAAQGRMVAPDLYDLVGTGKPASTPPLEEMLSTWRLVTAAADPYLDTLTPAILETHLSFEGQALPESVGTMLSRNLFHYWYHIGEASAVRQMLGLGSPVYVGNMSEAGYVPET